MQYRRSVRWAGLALVSLLSWVLPPVFGQYGKTDIADLVLIYQGGVHRPMEWTAAQFSPYVVHTDKEGKKNWLFDAFLFLEFKDGKGHTYAPGYDKLNARQPEWEWLLDRVFEKDKAFDALDQCIREQKKELGKPGFRHKVIAGLPSPILDQKDWGALSGKDLDFSDNGDRLAAARWYVDRFLERFKAAGYEHIDLAGFYWVDEDVRKCADILVPLGDYIRSKQYRFYWIPYWKAQGYDRWEDFKFDFAWIQPNHFFNPKVGDGRIEEAASLAYRKHMGLEMEFDARALRSGKVSFHDRLRSYIRIFEEKKVFSEASVAYYEGGNGVYLFSRSTDPRDKELIDELARHITARKSRKFFRFLRKGR